MLEKKYEDIWKIIPTEYAGVWEQEAEKINSSSCFLPVSKSTGSGHWVTHACFLNCGGRCVNRSFVKDGKVLYQKTDDLHEDSPDYPQQRGCARGRALRQMIFGADRLKFPLKRKHWKPGGGDKSLRGKDEWERISWEEALDIVALETTRIKNKYGNRAILATGFEQRGVIPGMYFGEALNAYGGCTTTWGQASQGAMPVVANMMKGKWNGGRLDTSDRFEIRNSKLIVLWAVNSAWSAQGNISYHYLQAKEAGARIIVVDTWYSPTCQALADQWIPVRPGTDTALLLSIAYCMIEQNIQNQEFLDQYCIGFDEMHMPEGADPKDNFKDYILGTYDKVPKTPEWASEICGTSVAAIRKLAVEMATVKPMSMKSSFAPARTYEGGRFAQAFYTVGWMTGNVGVSGSEVSVGTSAGNSIFGGPPLVFPGDKGLKLPDNPVCTLPRGGGMLGAGKFESGKFYGIAMSEVWSAVVNGEHTHFLDGKRPIDIQMIWKIGCGGRMNQNPDFNMAVKAFQKVEFVVTSDLQMTPDCQYSDIILPASSFWERFGSVLIQTNRELLIYSSKVTEPLFECRHDSWIQAELCKRWGLDPKLAQPLSDEQIAFNELSGAKVIREDGSGYETLISFTEEDIKEMGVVGTAQNGRIPWSEFRKTGVYQVKRYPNDPFGYVEFSDYVKNPKKYPLKTKSGKLEIYSSELVKRYEEFGLTRIDPVAKYNPPVEGYEDTYDDFNKKIKGKYPFQMVSIHHLRRAHQAFDNVKVLRELFPGEALMNEDDGKRICLKHGDTVLISSKHGKILRRIGLTSLVMPGVILVGQGSWTKYGAKQVDIGGNTNSLTGSHLCGEGQSAWNTVNVNVEKWMEDELEPDYLWPMVLPKMEE